MKVTSHQTNSNEFPVVPEYVSVEEIKIKNGITRQRSGRWRRTPLLADSQTSERSTQHTSSRYLCEKRLAHYSGSADVEKAIEQNLNFSTVNCTAPSDFSILERSCDVKTDKDSKCMMISDVASPNWKFTNAGNLVSRAQSPPHWGSEHGEGCLLTSRKSSGRVYSDGCDTSVMARCKWSNCVSHKLDADSLLEHIRSAHISTQIKPLAPDVSDLTATPPNEEPSYVCLWAGCKVYNKASCLLSWLERHIHCHVGAKPHRCIVAGCGARFASQFMLQRHVNGHFTMAASPSISAFRPSRKSDSINRLSKKRKLRFFRPCPVRFVDYFDSCVMESIRTELIKCAHDDALTTGKSVSGNTITFQRSIVARRTTNCGRAEVLLHWKPSNVLPDEWLLESDAISVTSRTLPLSCLPYETSQKSHNLCALPRPLPKQFHRHRRK